MAPTS
ncbi:hypothetical protein E2C01_076522 [Portunus trituberculatus]|jgi:integrase